MEKFVEHSTRLLQAVRTAVVGCVFSRPCEDHVTLTRITIDLLVHDPLAAVTW